LGREHADSTVADDGVTEVLSLSDVRVRYGPYVAVERASFSVAQGECLAMIGPNGSGKSSIGMAIAGILPYTGRMVVMGEVAPRADARWMTRRGVILVPERRQLFPHMTVDDNVLLGCRTWTRSLRVARRSQPYLRAFEFFPELRDRRGQHAGTLSGGEQQMVALARGLAGRPRLLIIDEPCLGLAEVVSNRVYELLRQLAVGGQTVLLIEENPQRAIRVAHRSIRVERGITSELAVDPATGNPATDSSAAAAAPSGH
jgi:branched-chain amino acid transport system ATP-binding protein